MNFGLHNLQDAPSTARRRVWATPLWQNLVFLAFLALVVGSVFLAAWFNPEGRELVDSIWMILAWVFVVFVVGVIAVGLVAGALHRGRLVLDFGDRSLSFFHVPYGRRPAWTLQLDDIAALVKRSVTVSGSDSNDTPWTYQIVVAELRDGRLASIAFDSAGSVFVAIRRALEPR